MEKLKKLEKLSLRSTIVLLVGKTLKALSLNSRGYAARRTYGNRTTVRGMHADGVPQQRGWATPSGSMSRVMHFDSVGSANPRLLRGDRVAVIRGKSIVSRSNLFALLAKNSFRSSFARLLPKGRKNFSNFFNS